MLTFRNNIRPALKSAHRVYRQLFQRVRVYGKPKIFGIGRNKTGTTSLKKAMSELGFVIANQREAELMLEDYASRDFRKLIKYCKNYEFFQDFPFSFPYTYIIMDQAFPGSKFILTVRNSPEEWYSSLIKFQTKMWGKNGKLPQKKDLQEATYIYKGRPWQFKKLCWNTPEDDIYNKEILIEEYIRYNAEVRNYFKNRPDDLLVLNVSKDDAYLKLINFLGLNTSDKPFPWVNKTQQ